MITISQLEALAAKAARASNATLLNRYLDEAIEDNMVSVIRGKGYTEWEVASQGSPMYAGPFTTIRASVVSIIESRIIAAEQVDPPAISTADIEKVLESAGRFDVYVLHDHDTGKIEIEHMPPHIPPAWADHIEELVCVEAWKIGAASRAKDARSEVRRLLEAF